MSLRRVALWATLLLGLRAAAQSPTATGQAAAAAASVSEQLAAPAAAAEASDGKARAALAEAGAPGAGDGVAVETHLRVTLKLKRRGVGQVSKDKVSLLRHAYAGDLARAAGLPRRSIMDLRGAPGRVTLRRGGTVIEALVEISAEPEFTRLAAANVRQRLVSPMCQELLGNSTADLLDAGAKSGAQPRVEVLKATVRLAPVGGPVNAQMWAPILLVCLAMFVMLPLKDLCCRGQYSAMLGATPSIFAQGPKPLPLPTLLERERSGEEAAEAERGCRDLEKATDRLLEI